MKLSVTQPFGDRERGSEITDPDQIAAILASEQAHFVVQVEDEPEAPIEPAPTPSDAKSGTKPTTASAS